MLELLQPLPLNLFPILTKNLVRKSYFIYKSDRFFLISPKLQKIFVRNLPHRVSLVIVVKTGKSHLIDENLVHPLSYGK